MTGIGQLRSSINVLIAGFGFTIANIVPNIAREHRWLLCDDPDMPPQFRRVQVSDIDSIQGNTATLRIVET